MKLSNETFRAVEFQIDSFKSRIESYQTSITRLNKMPHNDVVYKSIDGYKKQMEFLSEKITLLENDLLILQKINE